MTTFASGLRSSSEYRVLNSVTYGLKHNLWSSLGSHGQKAVLVVLLQHSLIVTPRLEALSDEILSILRQPLQSLLLSGKLWRVDIHVEELAGSWVNSARLQPVD